MLEQKIQELGIYESRPFKNTDYTSLTLPYGITSIGSFTKTGWTSNNQGLIKYYQ